MSVIPRRSNLGHHWNLKESIVFLNHGSFGACPKEILDYQKRLRDELELDPINFLDVKAKKLWAEAIAIFFVAPLFITLLSIPILREQVGLRRWTAIIIGLGGVVLMIQPGRAVFDWSSLLPLAAALSYASMQTITRKIGKTDKASTMGFYMQATMIVTSIVIGILIGDGRFSGSGHSSLEFLLRAWAVPKTEHLWILLSCGLLSGIGSYLLSQSYRLGQATLIAPFEYTALPLSVVLGFIIWNEIPTFHGAIGMLLIIGAGLYTLYRERSVSQANRAGNA